MTATLSKEEPSENELQKRRKERERKVRKLLFNIFLSVTQVTLPVQAGPMVAGDIYQGDMALAGKFMANMASFGAAFEMLRKKHKNPPQHPESSLLHQVTSF